MTRTKVQHLLHQYFNNTISNLDCMELLDYLNEVESDKIDSIIDKELFHLEGGPNFNENQAEEVLNRIKFDLGLSRLKSQGPLLHFSRKLYPKHWIRAMVASILLCLLTIWIIKYSNPLPENKLIKNQNFSTISPGGYKAILITSNGRKIILTKATDSVLPINSSSKLVKVQNGQILYNSLSRIIEPEKESSYNTLSTPNSGEFQITLSDGTRIWLNAASSIRYPVAFIGKVRQVTLTGEGYFEVAKDKNRPFYVNVNGLLVKVLGTHFNISAYSDDKQITTTLLEGSVELKKNKTQAKIKPGQQAILVNGSHNIQISQADINYAMAWKNGYFVFDDDEISGIMRKISRWYNIEIEYRVTHNHERFGGTFYRSKSLSELLHYLEVIGKLHFSTIGRRVIVME
jgi:transmembrane sensor